MEEQVPTVHPGGEGPSQSGSKDTPPPKGALKYIIINEVRYDLRDPNMQPRCKVCGRFGSKGAFAHFVHEEYCQLIKDIRSAKFEEVFGDGQATQVGTDTKVPL